MKKNIFADLYTHEGENLSGTPWNTYPRPQMKRDSFFCLNGEWEFCTAKNGVLPGFFGEKITVPFPPQSLLSGLHRNIPEEHYLFYKKTFRLPEGFSKEKTILHFGAVDQYAKVWLNGELIGEHEGGYEHFSFDITSVLKEENVLIVRAKDEMSSFVLPYGKQSANRGGMWYTPVSGIWQTVWIESISEKHITAIDIKTGTNFAKITVSGNVPDGTIKIKTPDDEVFSKLSEGKTEIVFDSPRMWSPEDPFLYECEITAGNDKVSTYFALRTLSIENFEGTPRLCLNGKPYFFHGLLDQGYWSDGIFTPASPACYEKDILTAKSLGFNTLRKHIKIEPEQFYYDCDRLGMVVFQDMVNNGDYSFFRDTAFPTVGFKKRNDKKLHRDPKTRKAFLDSMEKTVEQLKNHPCICYWTIFNEGWGQFNSTEAYRRMKELDDSRFIGSTSGWFKGGESNVISEHCYFKPFKIKKYEKPLVLTEFGGYAFSPAEHAFNPNNEYGYKKFKSLGELVSAVSELYERDIIPAVEKGLCAAIYTQVSDVEDETNGILSFDRKVLKIKPEEFLSISEKIYDKIKNAGQ